MAKVLKKNVLVLPSTLFYSTVGRGNDRCLSLARLSQEELNKVALERRSHNS